MDIRTIRPRGWCFPLLLAAMLAAGCRTSREPLFTTSGPGWRVREGQALWRPRATMPQIAGEIIVATHPDGRWTAQFTKTPLPLVAAQRDSSRWLIEFPPRKMSFAGGGGPPTRFAWLYLVPALNGEQLPRGYKLESTADGQWAFENTRSGERLEGFLAP
jgi:hypothetical protein